MIKKTIFIKFLFNFRESLNQVQCKALILTPTVKSSNYLQMMNDIIPNLSSFDKGKIKTDKIPSLKNLIFADLQGFVFHLILFCFFCNL